MSKRVFQILDEMNLNDAENKTQNIGLCNHLVSANKAKGGGHVTMGGPVENLFEIMRGEKTPILLLLNKKEYERIESLMPNEQEAQECDATKMPQ